MLYLIGLGLESEKDLTIKAVETLQKCDVILLEDYTGLMPHMNIKDLEKLAQKEVTIIRREETEKGEWIKQAKNKNIALLVQGDPLCATTHTEIILEAQKQKIKTKIIHNASIISAISETGLQIYKFGKITSIPFWTENYQPTSFLKTIEDNQKINAHTLILLDLRPAKKKFMNAGEALEKVLLSKNITTQTRVVIVSRLGSPDQKICYGQIKSMIKQKFKAPIALIIPSKKLHFKEKEMLEKYKC